MITLLAVMFAAAPVQDTVGLRYTMTTVQQVTPAGRAAPTRHQIRAAGHLSVELRDTLGGVAVHIVVDSSTLTSDRDAPDTENLAIPVGTTFTLHLRGGHPMGAVMPDSHSLGALQAIPLVEALFPRLRPDATVDDRWTDTSTVTTAVAGMPSTGHRTTRWHVVDRQDGLMMVEGVTEALSTTTLDADNTLSVTQHGSVRAAVRLPGPVDAARVIDTATIDVRLGGVLLRVEQQTTITIGRDPPPLRAPRRRVPG